MVREEGPVHLPDAQPLRYDVIVTSDPDECDAVRKSRLHRVSYEQKPGIRRLALAIASMVAAMPDIVEELETIRGQRLVSIISLSPRSRRYEVVDPRRDPPPYWR